MRFPQRQRLLSRLLQCLAEIGRLSGELTKYSSSSTTTINNLMVINSPTFARIQSAILSALAPHAEARLAVISALRTLEIEAESPPPLEASPDLSEPLCGPRRGSDRSNSAC